MDTNVGFSFGALAGAIGYSAVLGGLVYIGSKLNALNTLQATVEKIKDNLKMVTDAFFFGLPADPTKLRNYSPARLTGEGESYLAETGFLAAFTEHAADFFAEIGGESPETDYDVESAAMRSVLRLFDRDYFAPVKDHLYNHPAENRAAFIRLAGTYVRDRYLARGRGGSLP